MSQVANHKTLISKPRFFKILGLVTPEVSVDPESIPTTYMIEMFFHIGYTGDISLLSKFRKLFLLSIWNGLFTLLFKSLSERVTGSNIPMMNDLLMAKILILQMTTLVMSDPRNFKYVGSIPKAMLEKEDKTLRNEEEYTSRTSEPDLVDPIRKISISLSSPIYSDSTLPTILVVSTPPEVPIFKSTSEDLQTLSIAVNVYDDEATTNVGVTSEPGTSTDLPFNEDEDIFFGDKQEPI
ncbi:unnamed protein product [Lactuca saligna]|uniref:Uncharacterized protein n=1 Tax=Lactuca saligna TaxID=75948 RepID=A0AA35ZQA5_LACSI|nr:unnamed protein product [Lactuca saligna]